MSAYVHHSTIYKSQDRETTYVSFDRGMDKEGVVHTDDGILLSHQKEWNSDMCSNTDGPRDYHVN